MHGRDVGVSVKERAPGRIPFPQTIKELLDILLKRLAVAELDHGAEKRAIAALDDLVTCRLEQATTAFS
jgi:hypothetical protein